MYIGYNGMVRFLNDVNKSCREINKERKYTRPHLRVEKKFFKCCLPRRLETYFYCGKMSAVHTFEMYPIKAVSTTSEEPLLAQSQNGVGND